MTKKRKSPKGTGKAAENLYNIHKTLETQNCIIQQMLDAMPKQAGKFTSMLETVVLVFSIFGIVGVADTIMKWIWGG